MHPLSGKPFSRQQSQTLHQGSLAGEHEEPLLSDQTGEWHLGTALEPADPCTYGQGALQLQVLLRGILGANRGAQGFGANAECPLPSQCCPACQVPSPVPRANAGCPAFKGPQDWAPDPLPAQCCPACCPLRGLHTLRTGTTGRGDATWDSEACTGQQGKLATKSSEAEAPWSITL